MTEKLGIETVKPFIRVVVTTAQEVIEAKQNDGKISKMELIGLGDNAIQIGSNVLKAKTILAEIKDADSEERKELVEFVISLGVASEDVEFILEHTYLYLEGQWQLYQDHLGPIIKRIKEIKGRKE